ncbi:hypothetical protein QOZ80_5BG0414040 [Eleusine coracana subsp. coracana]|nr:hypothetical protein QOZ80_5BG0414040 [Eleusine coracana subsp. coracana]
MESLSLSNVTTIVRIAQDIAAAVATVGRNKKRCQKLGKRVEGMGDLLRELDAVAAGTTTKTDAATQRLLDRLQETLGHALRLVRACRDSGCPLSLLAGGRISGEFDDVDGEIDRCLLDLGVANRILIARLEKQLLLHRRQDDQAGGTETAVTLRVGMPRDDNADDIQRCIRAIQGVTGVSSAVDSTNNKDKFTVTVRSGAVDIPSLLDRIQQQLNRNVEVVTPAAISGDDGVDKHDDVKDHDKKANQKSAAAVEDRRSDKQRHGSGAELKKEKTMAGVNQQQQQASPAPYVYLPFKVALVPAGDAGSAVHVPSQHGFVSYAYSPHGSHPVHAQMQSNSNSHRVSVNKYDCNKDENNKGKVTSRGGGEWDEAGDQTMATGNVAAIGVPLHTVTAAGVPELVRPPSSYGRGYWPYDHGRRTGGGCCHCNAGGPSGAAPANNYSQYRDMFSDENPNAYCSIMFKDCVSYLFKPVYKKKLLAAVWMCRTPMECGAVVPVFGTGGGVVVISLVSAKDGSGYAVLLHGTTFRELARAKLPYGLPYGLLPARLLDSNKMRCTAQSEQVPYLCINCPKKNQLKVGCVLY